MSMPIHVIIPDKETKISRRIERMRNKIKKQKGQERLREINEKEKEQISIYM